MKPDDFLKCKKVRCVTDKGDGEGLTVGKEYKVIDTSVSIKVLDDEGHYFWRIYDRFEPVIDDLSKSDTEINTSANSVDLHHEFKALDKPKFKVGDKVYYFGEQYIYTYIGMDIAADGTILSLCAIDKHGEKSYTHPVNLCHATPENHALLSQLYPHIEFEAPPKPLTGSDLARAMLDKGWKFVPCFVSDTSEEIAVIKDASYFVDRHDGVEFFEPEGTNWRFAVPFDPRTGELLTESILND